MHFQNTFVYYGCFKKNSSSRGNSLVASFSIASQIVENQLQRHFTFHKSLSTTASDKSINSSAKPCENLLEIKQLNQKIKQLHTIEKQEIISCL